MNCPVCGKELLIDTVQNPRLTAVYCVNGDFCTDYYIKPSLAIAEAESMIKASERSGDADNSQI